MTRSPHSELMRSRTCPFLSSPSTVASIWPVLQFCLLMRNSSPFPVACICCVWLEAGHGCTSQVQAGVGERREAPVGEKQEEEEEDAGEAAGERKVGEEGEANEDGATVVGESGTI